MFWGGNPQTGRSVILSAGLCNPHRKQHHVCVRVSVDSLTVICRPQSALTYSLLIDGYSLSRHMHARYWSISRLLLHHNHLFIPFPSSVLSYSSLSAAPRGAHITFTLSVHRIINIKRGSSPQNGRYIFPISSLVPLFIHTDFHHVKSTVSATLWNLMTCTFEKCLSINHDLVTQVKPQTLMWSDSFGNYFLSTERHPPTISPRWSKHLLRDKRLANSLN